MSTIVKFLVPLRIASQIAIKDRIEECCQSDLKAHPPKSIQEVHAEFASQVSANAWQSLFVTPVGEYSLKEACEDHHLECLRTHIKSFYNDTGLEVIIHRRCVDAGLSKADVFVQVFVPEQIPQSPGPQSVIPNAYLPPLPADECMNDDEPCNPEVHEVPVGFQDPEAPPGLVPT